MCIHHAKGLPPFPFARTTIERSKLGWLLIAIIAVIAADGMLAAGAWYAVGFIIGNLNTREVIYGLASRPWSPSIPFLRNVRGSRALHGSMI